MKFIYPLIFTFLTYHFSLAQCPGSLTCEGSSLFCSAGALNGLTCTTPSSPNASFPLFNLCFGSGTPTNVNWWTFVGSGGPLQININYNLASCQLGEGIAAGVFEGSCVGNNVWDCNANCNSSNFTLSGTTEPCEVYHLWVDGCESDVCTYTMTFTGNTGPPSIPSPLPPLTTRDRVCPGGRFEVCAPSLGDCEPTYEWMVDGVIQGRGTCVLVNVPESAPSGQNITVCYTATIGNPDNPNAICDQAQRCSQFVVEPIETHIGSCKVVCFEDQPFIWNGQVLTQSCINPPCSTRVQLIECAVDSLRSFILLSPPSVGQKDTLICDEFYSYRAEDNRTYQGDICEQMIEFTREVLNPNCSTSRPRCDTSYILSIARPTYTADWQFDCAPCEGEISLSANITLDNDCPTFIGRLRTQLLWTSEDGDTLGITDGSGAITVDHPGVYCVKIEVILDDLFSCHVEAPSCINIPDVVFPDSVDIDGPTRLCEDSIATYFAPLSPDICEISWQVSDNGTIIKDTIINDSALVTISWDTAVQDTGLVCIDLKSDCGITTSCFITRICPISTEVTSTASIAPSFRYAGGWLHWSGLSPNGAARLSLISTDGRMILTNTIAQERGRLQLPSTPPGIYLIHWQIDDQRQGSLKIYLPSD